MLASTRRRLTLALLCLVLALGSTVWAAKPVPTKADIAFGPHPHQLLDIYLPPEGKGPFPVVIWFGALWTPSKSVPPVHAFFPDIAQRSASRHG